MHIGFFVLQKYTFRAILMYFLNHYFYQITSMRNIHISIHQPPPITLDHCNHQPITFNFVDWRKIVHYYLYSFRIHFAGSFRNSYTGVAFLSKTVKISSAEERFQANDAAMKGFSMRAARLLAQFKHHVKGELFPLK